MEPTHGKFFEKGGWGVFVFTFTRQPASHVT